MLRSFIAAPGWFQKIAIVVMVGLLGMTLQVLYQHTKDTAVGWEGSLDEMKRSDARQNERLATVESAITNMSKSQSRMEDRVESIYQHLLGQKKK